MKILITEAYNLAGDSLLRVMKSETNYDLYLLSGKAKDIYSKDNVHLYPANVLDIKSTKKLIYDIQPDVIINTVDYGDILSNDKIKMQDYNVNAAEIVFSISRVLECQLIALSNEFIFDGERGPYSEHDKPSSTSYYGNTKHAMENSCIGNVNNSTLVRHSLLFGYNSLGYSCFSSEIINKLNKKEEYHLKNNYMTNPCFTDEFAYSIIKIIEKKRTGIYNMGGKDYMSISDFCSKLALNYDLDPSFIDTVNSYKMKKYGFVNFKAETDLGIKFTSVESCLTSMKHYIYGDKLLPL